MNPILNDVEQYVSKLLTEKLDKNLYFHNLKHTRQVLKAAQEISENMDLKEITRWNRRWFFAKMPSSPWCHPREGGEPLFSTNGRFTPLWK